MFGFLFNVFDRLVAKNCPLHLAVISGHIEEAARIIRTNPAAISQVDDGGRTAVHVMAQYGFYHPEVLAENLTVQDDMVNLIEDVPSELITNTKDTLLEYDPLDYAIASRSFAAANKLCEKSQILDLHAMIEQKEDMFTYCDLFAYKSLFKLLLPYYVSIDLLLLQEEPDTTLETYCTLETPLSDNKNIYEYAKERGAATLLEMFQSKPGYYKHLQFAAAFGTEDNVLALLSEGVPVDEDDVHNNMPLHYAAVHGRLEIVKLLLAKGAELEEPGYRGNTPLHYAAKYGHDAIVKELLARGADINLQNYEEDTPLLLAVMNYEVGTAKLLIANGAAGDVQNDLKDSALSCAAEIGYSDVLAELLKTESCLKLINMGYEMDRRLLHYALAGPWNDDSMDLENQKCIVRLLIDNGADVNLQDGVGNTALHEASKYNVQHPKGNDDLKKFFEDVVLLLLSKGADISIENNAGKTALDLAIGSGNAKTAAVLEKLTHV